MPRLSRFLLFLLGWALAFQIISHTFDGDFGWHLRFGEAAARGQWPSVDTVTWTHAGAPWVNHEWGSDILGWWLYSAFGYTGLAALTALAIWLGLVLAPRIFLPRLSAGSLLVALLGLYSIDFLLAPRATTVAPLFFVSLWSALEAMPRRPTHRLLPAIMWGWAAFHGSWPLGLFLLGAYFGGYYLQAAAGRLSPRFVPPPAMPPRELLRRLPWVASALAVTLLNPYGVKLWVEVSRYFTSPFYQSVINEWVPSYTYPVFPLPLILGAISVVLLGLAARRRLVSFPHLLLFAALAAAAWSYKRQAVYLVLVSVPVLAVAGRYIISEIKCLPWFIGFNRSPHWPRLNSLVVGITSLALIGLIAWQLIQSRYSVNVWRDQQLLESNGYPYRAAEWLRAQASQPPRYVFNEFSWGGVLGYLIPNARLYLDGRGTATWRLPSGELSLQAYRRLRFSPGGLAAIELSPAEFIILARRFTGHPPPTWINRQIFTAADFRQLFPDEPTALEAELAASPRWQLVYSDELARIWRRREGVVR